MRRGFLLIIACGALSLPGRADALRGHLESEETLSEILSEPTAEEAEKKQARGEEEEETAARTWAVLPQFGFGPETGFLFGAKFLDRNLADSGATINLDGVFAVEGQTFVEAELALPTLFGEDFPLLIAGEFNLDPRRRFFGLGNNRQGPDPASSHELQDFGGEVTLGWRLIKDLSINLQVGGFRADVHDGKRVDHAPFTPQRFPNLPGIDGGVVVPLAVSVVYNQRTDVVRPVEGWRVIAKVSHTDSDLGSDFDYTNFILDAGYLYPLFDEWVVLGAHVGAEYIDGAFTKIPFWDLAELGSDDTLRGYFPYRFFGTASVWMNTEARVHLFDADIFDWWKLRVDGVGFTDFGRVFIDNRDLESETPPPVTGGLRTTSDLPVSYGGGLRLGFSEAIVARLDVAFSNEETGLVYFTFGHTF